MHGLASKAFLLMQLVFEINCHMDLLRRDARVRVKMWLEKLRQAPFDFLLFTTCCANGAPNP